VTTKSKILVAYHGDPKLKASVMKQLHAHRRLEQIVQGQYWSGNGTGKGCAVGCLTHDSEGGHDLYPKKWGIPEELAHLEDRIFEGLPIEKAKDWPVRFMNSITPGADLGLVGTKFRLWLLIDPVHGVRKNAGKGDPWGVAKAIDMCAEVLHARIEGREPAWSAESAESAAWSAARSAAWSAESAAWSAAWSAARSAKSAAWSAAKSAAKGGESAAWGAESAASAAKGAAWSAAWSAASAAWAAQAKQLVKLCKAAPVLAKA